MNFRVVAFPNDWPVGGQTKNFNYETKSGAKERADRLRANGGYSTIYIYDLANHHHECSSKCDTIIEFWSEGRFLRELVVA